MLLPRNSLALSEQGGEDDSATDHDHQLECYQFGESHINKSPIRVWHGHYSDGTNIIKYFE